MIDYLFAHDITVADLVLNVILALAGIAVAWSLWKIHGRNGKYQNFNLVFLLVNREGYPDGAKCIEMGTWLLLSWGLIVYITKGNLPEWYLITYTGAFIARAGYGAYLRSRGNEPPETLGTRTETTATVKTVEVVKPEEKP